MLLLAIFVDLQERHTPRWKALAGHLLETVASSLGNNELFPQITLCDHIFKGSVLSFFNNLSIIFFE
jgi:hypothetical protein